MRQVWAGAALTALLTVAISGVVAGRVYVPLGPSNAGVIEAAAPAAPAPAPSAVVTLTYPTTADRPTDGTLTLELGSFGVVAGYSGPHTTPFLVRSVSTLTYNGSPLAGQYVEVRVVAPAQAADGSSQPYCNTTAGCRTKVSLSPTDANGQSHDTFGITAYDRGSTLTYTASATYLGRSVLVTRRVLIQ